MVICIEEGLKMKVAVGALLFEGNAFSLSRCGLEAFSGNYLLRGEEVVSGLRDGDVELSGAIETFTQAGVEMSPLIATHGGCGGAVTADAWGSLRDDLVNRIPPAGIDGIYLALHGGMICEGVDHPEVELLKRIRDRVGDVPIVISYDLHADITPELVAVCDGIVGYQQYPHDDAFETGVRGAGILLKILQPNSQVQLHMSKLAMLVSPTTASTKLKTAMRKVYKACRAIESLPGVLSVSVFPLTPWADRAQGGTAFVVNTYGNTDPSEHLESLSKLAWSLRHEFQPRLTTVPEALDETRSLAAKPVILSEMSDAVGAGGTGDSAFVLRELIDSNISEPFLVQVLDPAAVSAARDVGAGGHLRVRVGQTVDDRFSKPVELDAEVVSVHDGKFTYSGGIMSGIASTVGDSAVLRSGSATVLVTSRPAYEYGDEQYTAMGLNLKSFKYVVVKNPMNYRQTYSWAPALYALDTPGAACADLTKPNWQHCKRPFFPLDDQDDPIFRD